jgi:regulator of cell morphogenesis and NO signaling
MNINIATTVRELAVTLPGATRVFEKLGIDYCCGGSRTLADACVKAKVPVEKVTESLTAAEQETAVPEEQHDWQADSMTALIHHIVDKHHTFTREELPRIEKLMHKVCAVHGEQHPELLRLKAIFLNLKEELEPHLLKEEQILFPYITSLEAAHTRQTTVPHAIFGTVQNPVRMMNLEHDTAGDLLRELRETSSHYTVPPEACMSYHALYQALTELEADLHQHIHLENNILFLKAVTAEKELTTTR